MTLRHHAAARHASRAKPKGHTLRHKAKAIHVKHAKTTKVRTTSTSAKNRVDLRP